MTRPNGEPRNIINHFKNLWGFLTWYNKQNFVSKHLLFDRFGETIENKISPAEFVWFEDGQRNFEEDLLGGKDLKAYQLCPGVNEFLWFKDGDKNIDKQSEKVLKSNEDIAEVQMMKTVQF